MNDKSKTEKTAFGISKEEFQQMLEEQERSKPLEDEALERFVKKPEESNLSSKKDKIISSVNFILLFFLLFVMFTVSVVSTTKNIPIAILSMIGIIILIKESKRNDEENNKKDKWYSKCFIKEFLKGEF